MPKVASVELQSKVFMCALRSDIITSACLANFDDFVDLMWWDACLFVIK